LGRPRPKADCSLDSPLLKSGIKWDADALLKESKEEDDVLHASKIPTFNGALSTDDSEALCSFLAVPGLRVSLVLQFFSEKSRLTSLFSKTLRKILWSSTFSPDNWPKPESLNQMTGEAMPPSPILQAPEKNPSRLWSRQGLLFVELRTSPAIILKSCTDMITNAVDVASIADFTTPYADTFFFVLRLSIAVLNYARTVPETFSSNRHWPKDGFLSSPTKHVVESLKCGVETLSSVLLNEAMPLCQKWIDQSLAASNGMEEAKEVSSSDVDPNIPMANVVLHVVDDDNDDDDSTAAERLMEGLKKQGIAQEMAISANSHMMLLTSPSLCGESSFDYSTDDTGKFQFLYIYVFFPLSLSVSIINPSVY
jgi:hypothetical protein